MTARLPVILLAVCFFSTAVNVSFGQTFWQAGTGDWFTAANWTLGVPDAGSATAFDAVIDNGGTAQLQSAGGSVRRLRVGRLGGFGELLVDGGTLNVTDDLHLAEGVTGGAAMRVQGGATVNAVDTVVQFSSDDNCLFQITGAGTVYNATTSFIVGRAGNGVATLSVDGGAVLASGTSSISSNGGFGTATVDGAGSRWSTTGAFNVGNVSAGTLNILNGGTVHVGTALAISNTSNVNLNGGTLRFSTATGLNRLAYTAGTIQLSGNRTLDTDATVAFLYGPFLSPPASISILMGKALKVEGDANQFQNNRTVTVNGGSLSSTNHTIGLLTNGGGFVVVNSGGTITTTSNVTLGDVANAFGTATVSGAGSSWNIGGSATFGSVGTGTLSILDQALVHVGSALSINSLSTVTLNGGTLRLNTISGLNRLTYSSGTIQLAGDRGVGADATITALYGAIPTLPTGKGLTVGGTATLTKPLTIDGGAFKSTSLAVGAGGSLIFNHGVLELTGGSVSGLANLVVPANGEFRASGAATTRITAAAGSIITATGALTLGDAALPNGFYSNGDIAVGANVVTLADANDAVLDSGAMMTIGAGGIPGTLAAANGLTLDFGGNVIGHGAIDTPNSAAKPLINNGHITGASPAEPITLAGYVKGVGALDNVDVTGTLAPGFSPATVTLGSVAYAGQLEIELGGTALGSFDRLEHTLGAGIAQLGGSLIVSLINGFDPALGDSFEFLTAAGGVNGTFAAETLPSLAGGLGWNVNYSANSVVLEVAATPSFTADFDEDGDVDGNDLLQWRGDFGGPGSDADDDGDSEGNDFLLWQRQLGSVPAVAAVPEPATFAPALLALVLVARRPMPHPLKKNRRS
ncbi:MAG: hypothetical protein H0T51_23535 [Pirellulales bacterium]|nr:hypothetical protein [Pirellulales bacterium]